MKLLSSKAARLVAGLLLAVALLLIFFRGVPWSDIRGALGRADPLFLILVAAGTVAMYALRAWRWGALLAPLARVPFRDLYSATLIGFASGILIPRAGEVLRPYLIARRHPISTSGGFASIILERLFDVIAVLILFALYLYVLPPPPAQTRGRLLDVLKVGGGLAALAAVAVLALLVALYRHADPVIAVLARFLKPLLRRHADAVLRATRSFAEGLAVLQATPAHLAVILVQSMLLWLAICLCIHWNNLAFGLDLPFHSTFLMIAFLSVGVAVPTPGTVGGFHAAYLSALTEAYGIDKGTAAAAGIACHALNNLPVLLLGLALLGREGLSVGKVAQMTETAPDAGPQPGAAS